MNAQISRLALIGLALIVALILGTTYWQAWASAGLADRQDNAIQRVAQFTIERGKIYAGDGHTLLATNVRKNVDGRTVGSSRVDLQACKLEYSIVSPK